jgi:hypothetical protein
LQSLLERYVQRIFHQMGWFFKIKNNLIKFNR